MVTDNYWENNPYYNPRRHTVVPVSGVRTDKESAYTAGIPRIDPSIFANMGGNGGGLGGLFNNLKGKFKSGNGKFFAPGTSEKFANFMNKAGDPQFSWNARQGLQGWGKNLGAGANVITGVVQGLKAAKGLNDLSDLKDDTADIKSDIVTASYSNPLIHYDLNSDQMKLLRQLRRGTFDSDAGVDDIDWLGTLGGAAKGAIMNIGGGVPGMIIGAIGGGANSIIGDLNSAQGITNDELEALYQAILESEQQRNALKKQQLLQNMIY